MGRWLAALARRSAEENGERPKARTDETDKTTLNEVLSVLAAPDLSVCENFSGGDDFILEADEAPPAEVLDLLRHHKPGVLALVRVSEDTSPHPADVEIDDPATSEPDALEVEIEERAGLAEGGVPTIYLDAWARLNCQKPASITDAEWRRALDDGGRFLDEWGELAARLGWTADYLFSYPTGLVWWLRDDTVSALALEVARTPNGRMLARPSQPR